MTATHDSNVQLLAALVDSYDDIDPGVLSRDDRTFAPMLLAVLPPFPPGDWNEGHISKDRLSRHPIFSRYARSD
jgi:hypothetical protein